jgi:hypothetical protein
LAAPVLWGGLFVFAQGSAADVCTGSSAVELRLLRQPIPVGGCGRNPRCVCGKACWLNVFYA